MKHWISLHFNEDDPNTGQNENTNPRILTKCSAQDNKRTVATLDFDELLEPKSIEDLAVHQKKIQEVEQWLTSHVLQTHGIKMLLITGPTGSGKTTTLNLLCKSLGIEILEWINPIDGDPDVCRLGQMARISEFLEEAKYPSLFESNDKKKKIILIEDFPNSLTRNAEEFFSLLDKHSGQRLPLVFICTDVGTGSLNLAKNLFPQEIREKYKIQNISFNPTSPTILKNMMKNALLIIKKYPENYQIPPSTIIDAIVSSAMGDIRTAMKQLHFTCLKGATLSSDISKVKPGSKRKKKDLTHPLTKSMSKNEFLGLFHGIGRVLNPKRKETASKWTFQCDLNQLVDELSTQPFNCCAFLQENYLKYFGDLDDVCNAANVLSQSQCFLEKWTDRYDSLIVALWYSILGLMVHNNHRVSKWNQINCPMKTNMKVNNKSAETRMLDITDFCYFNKLTNTNNLYSCLK